MLSQKSTPIFLKLFLSFIIIVVLITSSLGFIFYNYFTKSFNSKVEQINIKMLENINSVMQNELFSILEKVYIDIIIQNSDDLVFLFNNEISTNSSKASTAYLKLKPFVENNSKLIDSIYVYYKEGNTVLSYPKGIRFLDAIYGNIDQKYIELFSRFMKLDSNVMWSDTSLIAGESFFNIPAKQIISVVYSYPFNLPGEQSKGCILINVNENAIHNIIKQTYPESSGYVYIANKDYKIISQSGSPSSSKVLNGDLKTIISDMNKGTNTTFTKIDGIESIVSYITIGQNDWRLVNVTPVDQFYKESYILKRTVIIICLSVLVMGLIISNIFSIKLNNPVKLLLENIMSVIDSRYDVSQNKNIEYNSINKALYDFSNKMTMLENTLATNRPVLRHNFVYDLFFQNIKDDTEFLNRLPLIGITQPFRFYYIMILNIYKSSSIKQSTTENQFVKYSLIEYVESQNDNKFISIAALINNTSIAILISTDINDEQNIINFAYKITAYANIQFDIKSCIACGNSCDNIQSLYLSIKPVSTLLEYSFYLPYQEVLTKTSILKRLENKDTIPQSYLHSFSDALQSSNYENTSNSVRAIIELAINESYSYESLKQTLLYMVELLTQFINRNNLDLKNYIYCEKQDILNSFDTIYDFENWFLKTLDYVIINLKEISNNKTAKLVKTAQLFIENNLNLPLSLEMVAKEVFVCPTYLSKVFKEETSENFTDYINRTRLQKASELILSNNMKIDEVATKVGFNNANYFIKKFKELYGMTPKSYRLSTSAQKSAHE